MSQWNIPENAGSGVRDLTIVTSLLWFLRTLHAVTEGRGATSMRGGGNDGGEDMA